MSSIPVPATKKTKAQQGFQTKDKISEAESEAVMLHSTSTHKPSKQSILFQNFKQLKADGLAMATNKNYKLPKLYSANGDVSKRWYIEFYFLYPGSIDQYKRFKEYLDINRIHNLSEKIKYGNNVVKYIKNALENGFNPFTDRKDAEPKMQRSKGIIWQITFIRECLNMHASKSQKATYTEMYNRLSLWIEENYHHDLEVNDITIDKVKEFKKWALYTKDLSSKTVNNTLAHLGIFWDLALDKKMVTSNPWRLVPKSKTKDKPVNIKDKIRFEPITDKEMKKIFPGLKKVGEQPFINFLSFVYYAWARPIEILRLKISDIEFERDLIRFRKTETKNAKANYVQIVPPLMDILNQMDLKKYPTSHYIFSTGYEPGTIQLNKNRPSEKWRSLVRDGLKINKDLYALKHTGNIEYLLNNKENLNLKWQQTQNRHSSAVMTEQYNRQLGAYFIDTKNLVFRKF
jgi:integrase